MKYKDRKKNYEAPEAEVICFDKEDVITASKKDTRLPAIVGRSFANFF